MSAVGAGSGGLPTFEVLDAKIQALDKKLNDLAMSNTNKIDRVVPLMTAISDIKLLANYVRQGNKTQGEMYLQISYIADRIGSVAEQVMAMKGGKRRSTRKLKRRSH